VKAIRNTVSNVSFSKMILLAISVVLVSIIASGCGRRSRNTAMDDYNTRIKRLSKSNSADLLYSETDEYSVNLDQARGIAVDSRDKIYVVGDRSILTYTSTGASLDSIPMEYAPYAITVNDEDNIFVALQDHVRVFTSQGLNSSVWETRGVGARFCSISSNGTDVFVGDAGNKEVLHYDTSGKLLSEIGKGTFVVPSRHLDVCAVPGGKVWAVNPGKHSIALYSGGGSSTNSWGTLSSDIKGFTGCCNPTDIALTKDGYFVTSEKGIPRVKIYDPKGNFVCIVAPAEVFDSTADSLDLAVDSKGRVLVLDATRKCIRVFERRSKSKK